MFKLDMLHHKHMKVKQKFQCVRGLEFCIDDDFGEQLALCIE